MNVQIIQEPLTLTVHGFSGVATDKDYVGTAFRLMDRMWKIVKGAGLKNKGLNVWIYGRNSEVFAGVELDAPCPEDIELEKKDVNLQKYGYVRHVGPYALIKETGQLMNQELTRDGYTIGSPYIEIYGHWTED